MCLTAEMCINDARDFQRHGEYDLAIQSLQYAQAIDFQHEFEIEIQKLLSFNYRKSENYSLALLHINNAVNLILPKEKSQEDNEELAICLMNKGIIYEETGDCANAIKCYLPALKIFVDTFNSGTQNSGTVINALLTIGLFY